MRCDTDDDDGALAAAHLSLQAGLAGWDSDRDLDVVLAGWGTGARLLINDGSAGFTDRTEGSGLDEVVTEGAVRHATFGDLDGDGTMDLFITVATLYSDGLSPGCARMLHRFVMSLVDALLIGHNCIVMVSDAIRRDHFTLQVGMLLYFLQAVPLVWILPRHSVHKIEEVCVGHLDAAGLHGFDRVTLETPVENITCLQSLLMVY